QVYLEGSLLPIAAGVGSIGTNTLPFASGVFNYLKATSLDFEGLANLGFNNMTVSGVATVNELVLTKIGHVRYARGFASIQLAINDLPEEGGMVILSASGYVESGIITQGTDATVRSNVDLIGQGIGVTEVVGGDGITNNMVTANSVNGSVMNMSVDGNGSNAGALTDIDCIAVLANSVLISDVEVKAAKSHGVSWKGSDDLTLLRIQARNNLSHGIANRMISAATRASGVAILNCLSEGNGGNGYCLGRYKAAASAEPPPNLLVNECVARQNDLHGF
ncbi:unnamed protein product, partial [marine sediment metagenome]